MFSLKHQFFPWSGILKGYSAIDTVGDFFSSTEEKYCILSET